MQISTERSVGDYIMRSSGAVAVHVDAAVYDDFDVMRVFHRPVGIPLAHMAAPVLAEEDDTPGLIDVCLGQLRLLAGG